MKPKPTKTVKKKYITIGKDFFKNNMEFQILLPECPFCASRGSITPPKKKTK